MARATTPTQLAATAREGTAGRAVVRTLPGRAGDEALTEGLREREPWARAALFDRFAPLVERTLRRLLGPSGDDELADLVQEVFLRAVGSLDQIRDTVALPAWIQTIATRTAYRAIRNRRMRRWLCFWQPSELPELEAVDVPPEVTEAYRQTYLLLERMPASERVLLMLRFVEQLELTEIAERSGLSLATVKRRLARAQMRFGHAASNDSVLASWVAKGGRWGP